MREYETVLEAVKRYKDLYVTLIAPSMGNISGEETNLVLYEKTISFIDIVEEYNNAAIILVPVKETFGGIYGYSSILDALAVGKPILASATIGMGIDIDGLNIGRTYKSGDIDDLYKKYK